MFFRKRNYRTKKQKSQGIPKSVIPKPVSDKHIAQVAKKAIRIRQEEKVLFSGKNNFVPVDNKSFVLPYFGTPAINQNVYRLNEVNQGNLTSNRDGQYIEAVKLELAIAVDLNIPAATNINTANRCRIIVFWYNEDVSSTPTTNAGWPAFNEMFEYEPVNQIPFECTDSLYNHRYKFKQNVLSDKTYTLTSWNQCHKSLKYSINLKNKKISYSTNLANVDCSISHNLFILFMCDTPVGATEATNYANVIDFNYKFVFRDI